MPEIPDPPQWNHLLYCSLAGVKNGWQIHNSCYEEIAIRDRIFYEKKRNVNVIYGSYKKLKKNPGCYLTGCENSLKVGSRYSREIIPLKNKYQKVYLSYLLIFKLLINYIYKNCYSVPVLSIQYIQYMWFREAIFYKGLQTWVVNGDLLKVLFFLR